MSDPINPDYYKTEDGLEAIDMIEGFDLGYHLGNAVKYIVRAGKKDPDGRSDILKAIWYLQRENSRRFMRQLKGSQIPEDPAAAVDRMRGKAPPPPPMASFSNAGMDEARKQQLGSDFSYGPRQEPARLVPRQICPADDVTPGEEAGTFISRNYPPVSNA